MKGWNSYLINSAHPQMLRERKARAGAGAWEPDGARLGTGELGSGRRAWGGPVGCRRGRRRRRRGGGPSSGSSRRAGFPPSAATPPAYPSPPPAPNYRPPLPKAAQASPGLLDGRYGRGPVIERLPLRRCQLILIPLTHPPLRPRPGLRGLRRLTIARTLQIPPRPHLREPGAKQMRLPALSQSPPTCQAFVPCPLLPFRSLRCIENGHIEGQ